MKSKIKEVIDHFKGAKAVPMSQQPKLDTKREQSGEHWLLSGLRVQRGELEEAVASMDAEIVALADIKRTYERRLNDLLDERDGRVRKVNEVRAQIEQVLNWKRQANTEEI